MSGVVECLRFDVASFFSRISASESFLNVTSCRNARTFESTLFHVAECDPLLTSIKNDNTKQHPAIAVNATKHIRIDAA
jgi:hypothetical protein